MRTNQKPSRQKTYPIDISLVRVHIDCMNAPSKIDGSSRLFKLNRSQAVRIPKALAFPDHVKDVVIRRRGNEIIISPKDSFWTDFFARGPNPDFPERFPQGEYEERLSFDD